MINNENLIINYPINGNPICPNDRKSCEMQDMDSYTDCSNCSRYCNGVRETGGMPGLEMIYNIIKTKVL